MDLLSPFFQGSKRLVGKVWCAIDRVWAFAADEGHHTSSFTRKMRSDLIDGHQARLDDLL